MRPETANGIGYSEKRLKVSMTIRKRTKKKTAPIAPMFPTLSAEWAEHVRHGIGLTRLVCDSISER